MARNELQDQKRYVEQLHQELVAQRNFSMQHLHPASPIHSIQDDDDNKDQQDVQPINQSGPLTRADLSIIGSNPTPRHRNLEDGEQFRERHEAELADLRSRILELKQSQSAKIDQSQSSLSPIQQLSTTISNVTTVLAYPSKSDIPFISRWTSGDIDVFNNFCHNHRIFQLPLHDAW